MENLHRSDFFYDNVERRLNLCSSF